jgi:YgiT-type zinc finger domain-containing protein
MVCFRQCPVCNGELVEKEVQKLLQGGNDTAILKVRAGVCLQCGERLYSLATARQFEEIRERLKTGQTEGFTPIGQSFQVR